MTSGPRGRRIGEGIHLKLVVALILSAVLAGCAGDLGAAPEPPAKNAGGGLPMQGGTQPTTPPPFGSHTLQPAPITPTPAGTVRLYPISEPGCCSRPAWSADPGQVVFLDRPSQEAEIGIYGIPIAGGMKRLVTTRVGLYSEDWSLVAYPEGGDTFVERLSDQRRWLIPSKGRGVVFSRDASRIAWQAGSLAITNPDRRRDEIWVAQWDGSGERRLVSVIGGGLIGWAQDDEALIVAGRMREAGPSGIWRLPLAKGEGARLLWETPSPRGALLSPQGGWLAFYQAFSEAVRQNGLYVIRTDGSQGLRLEKFGSYRWRREGTLLLLPLNLEQPDAQLWEIDVSRAEQRQLEIPSPADFRIANNDWMPSPDGSKVVFVSSEDYALWILGLPGD